MPYRKKSIMMARRYSTKVLKDKQPDIGQVEFVDA